MKEPVFRSLWAVLGTEDQVHEGEVVVRLANGSTKTVEVVQLSEPFRCPKTGTMLVRGYLHPDESKKAKPAKRPGSWSRNRDGTRASRPPEIDRKMAVAAKNTGIDPDALAKLLGEPA